MSPGDPVILRRKLAVIVENLKALQQIENLPPDQYQADIFTRKGTERLLQELIEAAIDINTHILVMDGHGAPRRLIIIKGSAVWRTMEFFFATWPKRLPHPQA